MPADRSVERVCRSCAGNFGSLGITAAFRVGLFGKNNNGRIGTGDGGTIGGISDFAGLGHCGLDGGKQGSCPGNRAAGFALPIDRPPAALKRCVIRALADNDDMVELFLEWQRLVVVL